MGAPEQGDLVGWWSAVEEIFFFGSYAENGAGKLVSDLFLFIKKALYEVKERVCSLISIHFKALNLVYNKNMQNALGKYKIQYV